MKIKKSQLRIWIKEAIDEMTIDEDGDISFPTDGVTLSFGADGETTLQHIHNGGFILNSAMGLFFRDNGGEYIYSAGDGDLRIQSGDKLTTNAKVGIGTTSPTAMLHVSASTGATGSIIHGSTSGFTSNTNVDIFDALYLADTNYGGAAITFRTSTGTANSKDVAEMRFMTQDAGSNSYDDGAISWITMRDGTQYERMRIDSAGNVGIGTNAPTAPLTIEANGSHIHLDTPSSGQNNWITWKDNGSEKWEVNKDTSHNFNVYSYQASANLMQFLAAGTTLEFPTANFLISGSATTTGSFGGLQINNDTLVTTRLGNVGIGGTPLNPSGMSRTLELTSTSADLQLAIWSKSDRNQTQCLQIIPHFLVEFFAIVNFTVKFCGFFFNIYIFSNF